MADKPKNVRKKKPVSLLQPRASLSGHSDSDSSGGAGVSGAGWTLPRAMDRGSHSLHAGTEAAPPGQETPQKRSTGTWDMGNLSIRSGGCRCERRLCSVDAGTRSLSAAARVWLCWLWASVPGFLGRGQRASAAGCRLLSCWELRARVRGFGSCHGGPSPEACEPFPGHVLLQGREGFSTTEAPGRPECHFHGEN